MGSDCGSVTKWSTVRNQPSTNFNIGHLQLTVEKTKVKKKRPGMTSCLITFKSFRLPKIDI